MRIHIYIIFLLLFLLLNHSTSLVTTTLNATTHKIEEQWLITHTVALFGPQTGFNITMQTYIPEDIFLCNNDITYDLSNYVVVVLRGNCSFYDKAQRAQKFGAQGLIVGNEDDELFLMGYAEAYDNITIPSIMVRYSAYEYIANMTKYAIPMNKTNYNIYNDIILHPINNDIHDTESNTYVLSSQSHIQQPQSQSQSLLYKILSTALLYATDDKTQRQFDAMVHSPNFNISNKQENLNHLPPFFEGSNYPGTAVYIPSGYRTPFNSLYYALFEQYRQKYDVNTTTMNTFTNINDHFDDNNSNDITKYIQRNTNKPTFSFFLQNLFQQKEHNVLTQPLVKTIMANINTIFNQNQIEKSEQISTKLTQNDFVQLIINNVTSILNNTNNDLYNNSINDNITTNNDIIIDESHFHDGSISPILFRHLQASMSAAATATAATLEKNNLSILSNTDYNFIVSIDERGVAYLPVISIQTIRILLFIILLAPLFWVTFILLRWLRLYWGFRCVQELTSSTASQLPVCTFIRVNPKSGLIVWPNSNANDTDDDEDDFDLAKARINEDSHLSTTHISSSSSSSTTTTTTAILSTTTTTTSVTTPKGDTTKNPLLPPNVQNPSDKIIHNVQYNDKNDDTIYYKGKVVQICPQEDLYKLLSNSPTVSSFRVFPYIVETKDVLNSSQYYEFKEDIKNRTGLDTSNTLQTDQHNHHHHQQQQQQHQQSYKSFSQNSTKVIVQSSPSSDSDSILSDLDLSPTNTQSLQQTKPLNVNDMNCTQINQQNFYNFQKSQHHGRILNDTCHICLEKFNTGDQVKVLGCFHAFHTDCINHFFSSSYNNTTTATPTTIPIVNTSQNTTNGSTTTTPTPTTENSETTPETTVNNQSENISLTQEMYLQIYLSSNYDFDELFNYFEQQSSPQQLPLPMSQRQADDRTAGQCCPVCRTSILYSVRQHSLIPKKWWIYLFQWCCLCSCCCRNWRLNRQQQEQQTEPIVIDVEADQLNRSAHYTYQYELPQFSSSNLNSLAIAVSNINNNNNNDNNNIDNNNDNNNIDNNNDNNNYNPTRPTSSRNNLSYGRLSVSDE